MDFLSLHTYSGEEHAEIAIPLEFLLKDGVLQVFPEILKHDIFEFRFNSKKGFVFKAGRYIGIIPINNKITIDVKPRVPLRNLERILIKSGSSLKALAGFSQWFNSHDESFDSLLDFFADSLISSIEKIRHFGLYKEYKQRNESSFHPKGRLNLFKYSQQEDLGKVLSKVDCSWYERTIDNALNRCILAALESLSKKYARISTQRGALSRLRQINIAASVFSGVALDHYGSFLKDKLIQYPEKIPSLRKYYAEALGVSKAILGNKGVSFSNAGSEFSLSSLIIDMGEVFEGYVRNVLIRGVHTVNATAVDGNLGEDAGGGRRKLFEEDGQARLGGNVNATPDILIIKTIEGKKTPRLVIDAKYKIASPSAGRAEINQVVTYAALYGVDTALIVMPYHKETIAGINYLGRVGDIAVYQYNFDLAANNMDEEEKKWIDTVVELIL
ncbi:McrC family protein [Massilia sp. erpn]|uniref:McrC family protein n=1 Tax=Massilia sp. erpn TaxID=2738142 RepID=UPI0021069989|nr:McrC family protein [Massilia sp. erpn]UTY57389.1 hypothetical protein HPQ68_09395 [Massilia sp. erpn]